MSEPSFGNRASCPTRPAQFQRGGSALPEHGEVGPVLPRLVLVWLGARVVTAALSLELEGAFERRNQIGGNRQLNGPRFSGYPSDETQLFQSFQHGVHGGRRQVEELLKLGMRGCNSRVVVLHELANERQELALLSRWLFRSGPPIAASRGLAGFPDEASLFRGDGPKSASRRRCALAMALRAESICLQPRKASPRPGTRRARCRCSSRVASRRNGNALRIAGIALGSSVENVMGPTPSGCFRLVRGRSGGATVKHRPSGPQARPQDNGPPGRELEFRFGFFIR